MRRLTPLSGLVVLVALAGSGCILGVDVLQLAEQAKKKKREEATGRPVALEAWEPAPIELRRRPIEGATTFRVRVLADEEFRVANLRWQERIRALVSDASELLEEGMGAKLVVESIRSWARSGAKESTETLLRVLEEAERGDDVDWVIGFVSPLGIATTSIHEIGMARVLGKHFVLRGIDDTEEAAALARHFTDVSEKQRIEFLDRRRHHKELVVFLHEWFHNLGAIHHADREMLLHPSYAHQQRTLDPENAELIALALQARVRARGQSAAPDYRALGVHLESAHPPGWYRADRDQLVAMLAAQAAAPVAAKAASADVPAPAPVAAPAGLAALRAAVDEGRWDAAIAGCAGAPRAGAAEAPWSGELAELCARSGMIARAEERLAAARGGPHEQAAREAIARARLHYGVPPGSPALNQTDEAARAQLWLKVRGALDAGKLEQAEAALRPSIDRFGEDAGLLALRCEAAVRRSPTGQDRGGSCERAVAAWDQQPRALFWSAMAQANDGHRPVAVTRLQRATKVEPTLEGPWRMLADIYRIEGRRDELKSLRAEYQTRFGKPLR